jgi:3-hydroxyisobutyrate dehydrogenase-like beta-hydroxyacid dehydrogenase
MGERVGFVGLGVMGGNMARHLAAAGLRMTVYDLNPDAALALQAEHPAVTVAATPAEVAARSDVVVTMLPTGKEVAAVALGPNGLAEGLRPGCLLLDTSSSAPWHTRETHAALAARGVAMVDAPVSGAEVGARTASLVFMVGGAKADVARVAPLLEIMGKAHFHLGPIGSGDVMKAMNNLLTAVALTATTEVLMVGKKCGLDPAVMNDVLDISTGESWITRTHYRARVFNRAFDDTFTFDLMRKDMHIAADIAEGAEMPIPVAREALRLWDDLQPDLPKNSAISRLSWALEQRTGVTLVSGEAV